MTELKPLDESSIYKIAHIIAETNDGQVGAYTPKALELAKEIVKQFGHPQSLTEKVKWPDKLKACDAIYHSSDCECAEIEAYNKAIDLCKQSLNQASQEDREGLIKLVDESLTRMWRINGKRLVDDILKEYVLVRKL